MGVGFILLWGVIALYGQKMGVYVDLFRPNTTILPKAKNKGQALSLPFCYTALIL